MEKKNHQDMELLQDLIDKASNLDGVEVVPGDGFLMVSPVSLEHVRTFRHLTNVLDEEVDAAARLEAVGQVDFRHPEWDTHNSPDIVLWTPVEDPQRDAQLIELACEIVSPSSVENDYVRKVTAYAHAKIPVYLVLDPYTQRAVLFTRPDGGSYRTREEFLYGEPIELPLAPGPLRLDTHPPFPELVTHKGDFGTQGGEDALRSAPTTAQVRPPAGTPIPIEGLATQEESSFPNGYPAA